MTDTIQKGDREVTLVSAHVVGSARVVDCNAKRHWSDFGEINEYCKVICDADIST